ncbi:MAG TPA: GNAT family N-acetyltransferase [Micropepsaceae bacterium]|jgi:phosphinothricin acetyltransferase
MEATDPTANSGHGAGSCVIRPAVETDLPAILAIYNEAVLNQTSIWNDTIVDLADRQAWWETRVARGYPVLIAETGTEVTGYAAFGDFRPFHGYRHTVEHSIYVAPHAWRRGIGRMLLEQLIAEARTRGKHVMIGGIGADNVASLALHARMGFSETARMPEVGRKFGRWLDLVFVQKTL